MSGIVSITLVCDGYPDGRRCQSETPNMDLGSRTVAEARAEALAHGWRVSQPGGKDYCPDCAADGTMKANNARERARQGAGA